MNRISRILMFSVVAFAAVSCKKEVKTIEENIAVMDSSAVNNEKIVTLNGAITEIVSALGYEKNLVGRDVTSTYPQAVKDSVKDLGHVTGISAEAIMEQQPTLILATEKDLNPELYAKLKNAGVAVHTFNQEISVEGSKKLIADVGNVLHSNEYKLLQDKIDADLSKVKPIENRPKVLFIYARGANMLMVSGTGTPVDKVISLAGGQNAITEFEDYKPLTPEALIKGNPDVILMFDSGMESLGGPEGVLKIKGMDKTNAGKNKKIISMDGALLSGFGPRLGQAAAILNGRLRLKTEDAK